MRLAFLSGLLFYLVGVYSSTQIRDDEIIEDAIDLLRKKDDVDEIFDEYDDNDGEVIEDDFLHDGNEQDDIEYDENAFGREIGQSDPVSIRRRSVNPERRRAVPDRRGFVRSISLGRRRVVPGRRRVPPARRRFVPTRRRDSPIRRRTPPPGRRRLLVGRRRTTPSSG